jgi:hypothetical protein
VSVIFVGGQMPELELCKFGSNGMSSIAIGGLGLNFKTAWCTAMASPGSAGCFKNATQTPKAGHPIYYISMKQRSVDASAL